MFLLWLCGCLRDLSCFVQYEEANCIFIFFFFVSNVLKVLGKVTLFYNKIFLIVVLIILIWLAFKKVGDMLLIYSKVSIQRNNKCMQFRAWVFAVGLKVIISDFREVFFWSESDFGEGEDVGMSEGCLIWSEREIVEELGVILLSFLRVDDMVGEH
jgi:hypothetical protein